MSKQMTGVKKGTFIALVGFGLVLLLVGGLFHNRMEDLLSAYTESQTRRQAETLATQAAEKLGTELETLAYVAHKIEANPEAVGQIMPLIYDEAGVRQGLLDIEGKAIYGDAISPRIYSGIQTAFRGKSDITFETGQGLLFTYPVFNGKNIKYVLYRQYPLTAIADRFSISCYDGIGKMMVVSREGDVIIPFDESTPEDVAYMNSQEVKDSFNSMHQEMEVSVAAAHIFPTERGEMLLFEAEIPHTDFLLAGFVPKDKASEGIDSISLLVIWVFGLLMLMVVIGAIYLVRVRVVIQESDELRAAKEMAESASKAKSDFLSNMSHEIRTPINAVLGMNEMILRECEDKTLLGYSENIKTAGTTLLSLINDILDFSKIEAGKIDIIPVEYDLSVLLNDLVMMAKVRADKKDLSLTLDFDQDTPKLLYGDEVRIKQIITNILTNAVKYTEKGGVTFSLGFERIEGADDKVMLVIAIKDTGIGIKPEDLSKLFSKFERIEEKRNRNIEGTGLGMSITKMLLDMMDSHLEVDSVYGEGSTFSFRVEQKVTKWEPLGDYAASYAQMLKKKKKYREKFTAPEAHILVADDNEMNLLVFKNLLKKTKIQIDTVIDGTKAVEAAMARKYDIIFLDHMMPHKDGIQALHELRQHPEGPNSETPALCLTANAISGAREQYIEAGFNDYLTKPIDADKLEETLIEYLPDDKVVKSMEDSAPEAEGKPQDAAGDLPKILLPLQEQPWIDLKNGIDNLGSVDDYLPILKIFYESLDDKAAEIEGFYANEDWHNYTIKVHALKSSARFIGALEFGEKAQLLENAGKAGDIAYIRKHHEAFMTEYRSFKAPLAEVFIVSAVEKPEADAEMMDAILEEIRLAAESMDIDQLESIFDEMEEYQIPQEQEELWQQLVKAAQQYDYQKIVSILAK